LKNEIATRLDLADEAELAGLLHDPGKYAERFAVEWSALSLEAPPPSSSLGCRAHHFRFRLTSFDFPKKIWPVHRLI
jgi:hypothetical protein